MKKPVCYIVFFLMQVVAALNVSAQQPLEELYKINAVFHDNPKYRLDMEYLLYLDGALSSDITAEYFVDGSNFYYRMDDVESLTNNDWTITLNHRQKFLVVQNARKKQPFDFGKQVVRTSLDSLKRYIETMSMKDNGNIRTVSVIMKQGEYEKMEISYDKNTYVIKELGMYYDSKREISYGVEKKPAMIIRFRTVDMKPQYTDMTFSEKRFVESITDQKVIVKQAYKNYQLVQNIRIQYE